MTDRTNSQRQLRQIWREQQRGLMRKTVTIPAEREPELDDLVRQWRDQHPNVAEA